MKKSSLTTAVLAGLAGVVGFAGSSSAVEINPDGTGQVLIYPYYTVNAGQQTNISVVNSSDVAKAVKVRFLEAYNSREVLDFNLFLSPFDVWTGTVFALDDAGADSVGAAVLTRDQSCTVPDIVNNNSLPSAAGAHYVPFNNAAYQDDTGPKGIERTREGYVELIQMADIAAGSGTEAVVTHNDGVPGNCASPLIRTTANQDFVMPTGGLFGSGSIMNVDQGTLYPYSADAIDGFNNTANVTPSGSMDPNLTAALTAPGEATAYVFGAGGAVTTATYGPGYGSRTIDAVSAVFAANALMNEYESDSAAGKGTDWVVTFPTKRFYVDPAVLASRPAPDTGKPFAPFPSAFNNGLACAQVSVDIYDREEGTPFFIPGDVFSPPPEDQPPSSLCHEVNVITISDNNSSILGAAHGLNIEPYDASGWMKLNLDPAPGSEPHAMTPSAEGVVFGGLPATGFSAQRVINANAQPGMLSNYSGAWRHRVERQITAS